MSNPTLSVFDQINHLLQRDSMMDGVVGTCLQDLSRAVLLLANTDPETGKLLVEMCSKVRPGFTRAVIET